MLGGFSEPSEFSRISSTSCFCSGGNSLNMPSQLLSLSNLFSMASRSIFSGPWSTPKKPGRTGFPNLLAPAPPRDPKNPRPSSISEGGAGFFFRPWGEEFGRDLGDHWDVDVFQSLSWMFIMKPAMKPAWPFMIIGALEMFLWDFGIYFASRRAGNCFSWHGHTIYGIYWDEYEDIQAIEATVRSRDGTWDILREQFMGDKRMK